MFYFPSLSSFATPQSRIYTVYKVIFLSVPFVLLSALQWFPVSKVSSSSLSALYKKHRRLWQIDVTISFPKLWTATMSECLWFPALVVKKKKVLFPLVGRVFCWGCVGKSEKPFSTSHGLMGKRDCVVPAHLISAPFSQEQLQQSAAQTQVGSRGLF